jgi:hypothetical protein
MAASWSERLLALRSSSGPEEQTKEALRLLALEALGEGWDVEVRLAGPAIERGEGRKLVVSPLAFLPTLEATRRNLLGIPDRDGLRRILRDAATRPARAASALGDLARRRSSLPPAESEALRADLVAIFKALGASFEKGERARFERFVLTILLAASDLLGKDAEVERLVAAALAPRPRAAVASAPEGKAHEQLRAALDALGSATEERATAASRQAREAFVAAALASEEPARSIAHRALEAAAQSAGSRDGPEGVAGVVRRFARALEGTCALAGHPLAAALAPETGPDLALEVAERAAQRSRSFLREPDPERETESFADRLEAKHRGSSRFLDGTFEQLLGLDDRLFQFDRRFRLLDALFGEGEDAFSVLAARMGRLLLGEEGEWQLELPGFELVNAAASGDSGSSLMPIGGFSASSYGGGGLSSFGGMGGGFGGFGDPLSAAAAGKMGSLSLPPDVIQKLAAMSAGGASKFPSSVAAALARLAPQQLAQLMRASGVDARSLMARLPSDPGRGLGRLSISAGGASASFAQALASIGSLDGLKRLASVSASRGTGSLAHIFAGFSSARPSGDFKLDLLGTSSFAATTAPKLALLLPSLARSASGSRPAAGGYAGLGPFRHALPGGSTPTPSGGFSLPGGFALPGSFSLPAGFASLGSLSLPGASRLPSFEGLSLPSSRARSSGMPGLPASFSLGGPSSFSLPAGLDLRRLDLGGSALRSLASGGQGLGRLELSALAALAGGSGRRAPGAPFAAPHGPGGAPFGFGLPTGGAFSSLFSAGSFPRFESLGRSTGGSARWPSLPQLSGNRLAPFQDQRFSGGSSRSLSFPTLGPIHGIFLDAFGRPRLESLGRAPSFGGGFPSLSARSGPSPGSFPRFDSGPAFDFRGGGGGAGALQLFPGSGLRFQSAPPASGAGPASRLAPLALGHGTPWGLDGFGRLRALDLPQLGGHAFPLQGLPRFEGGRPASFPRTSSGGGAAPRLDATMFQRLVELGKIDPRTFSLEGIGGFDTAALGRLPELRMPRAGQRGDFSAMPWFVGPQAPRFDFPSMPRLEGFEGLSAPGFDLSAPRLQGQAVPRFDLPSLSHFGGASFPGLDLSSMPPADLARLMRGPSLGAAGSMPARAGSTGPRPQLPAGGRTGSGSFAGLSASVPGFAGGIPGSSSPFAMGALPWPSLLRSGGAGSFGFDRMLVPSGIALPPFLAPSLAPPHVAAAFSLDRIELASRAGFSLPGGRGGRTGVRPLGSLAELGLGAPAPFGFASAFEGPRLPTALGAFGPSLFPRLPDFGFGPSRPGEMGALPRFSMEGGRMPSFPGTSPSLRAGSPVVGGQLPRGFPELGLTFPSFPGFEPPRLQPIPLPTGSPGTGSARSGSPRPAGGPAPNRWPHFESPDDLLAAILGLGGRASLAPSLPSRGTLPGFPDLSMLGFPGLQGFAGLSRSFLAQRHDRPGTRERSASLPALSAGSSDSLPGMGGPTPRLSSLDPVHGGASQQLPAEARGLRSLLAFDAGSPWAATVGVDRSGTSGAMAPQAPESRGLLALGLPGLSGLGGASRLAGRLAALGDLGGLGASPVDLASPARLDAELPGTPGFSSSTGSWIALPASRSAGARRIPGVAARGPSLLPGASRALGGPMPSTQRPGSSPLASFGSLSQARGVAAGSSTAPAFSGDRGLVDPSVPRAGFDLGPALMGLEGPTRLASRAPVGADLTLPASARGDESVRPYAERRPGGLPSVFELAGSQVAPRTLQAIPRGQDGRSARRPFEAGAGAPGASTSLALPAGTGAPLLGAKPDADPRFAGRTGGLESARGLPAMLGSARPGRSGELEAGEGTTAQHQPRAPRWQDLARDQLDGRESDLGPRAPRSSVEALVDHLARTAPGEDGALLGSNRLGRLGRSAGILDAGGGGGSAGPAGSQGTRTVDGALVGSPQGFSLQESFPGTGLAGSPLSRADRLAAFPGSPGRGAREAVPFSGLIVGAAGPTGAGAAVGPGTESDASAKGPAMPGPGALVDTGGGAAKTGLSGTPIAIPSSIVARGSAVGRAAAAPSADSGSAGGPNVALSGLGRRVAGPIGSSSAAGGPGPLALVGPQASGASLGRMPMPSADEALVPSSRWEAREGFGAQEPDALEALFTTTGAPQARPEAPWTGAPPLAPGERPRAGPASRGGEPARQLDMEHTQLVPQRSTAAAHVDTLPQTTGNTDPNVEASHNSGSPDADLNPLIYQLYARIKRELLVERERRSGS